MTLKYELPKVYPSPPGRLKNPDLNETFDLHCTNKAECSSESLSPNKGRVMGSWSGKLPLLVYIRHPG